MTRNVCSKMERAVRVIIGIDLFALFILLPEPANLLGWLGVVPLMTVLFGYCPVNQLLGHTSCHGGRRPQRGGERMRR